MGERHVRNVDVVGSSPIVSTSTFAGSGIAPGPAASMTYMLPIGLYKANLELTPKPPAILSSVATEGLLLPFLSRQRLASARGVAAC